MSRSTPSMNIRSAVLVFTLFLGSACADKKERNTVELPPPAPQASAAAAGKGTSDCPATGLWAKCSVEKRLKQSGFVAQKNDSSFPRRSGFSVKPAMYTLNRSRLELYFYPDSVTLNREVPKMDTTTSAPVFIRAGNLAALLFTDDARQAERLSLALTAGAPQPVR